MGTIGRRGSRSSFSSFRYSLRRQRRHSRYETPAYCIPACRGGVQGFDDLRKIIKNGEGLCKDISAVIGERSELEAQYAKGLQKVSSKLQKICSGETNGTVTAVWLTVAEEMDKEAQAHRSLSLGFQEDIQKPLRLLADNLYRSRKPIEQSVEKVTKTYQDRRSEETKMKIKAFGTMAEVESLQDQLVSAQGKKSGDKDKKAMDKDKKDIAKLEKKLAVTKDMMRKTSKHYYAHNEGSEVARQEWESCLTKSSAQMRKLEQERLRDVKACALSYKTHADSLLPVLHGVGTQLQSVLTSVNETADIKAAERAEAAASLHTEQMLFETYAGDMENKMAKERRRQALNQYLFYLAKDVRKAHRTLQGLQKLREAFSNKPDFTDEQNLEDVTLQVRQSFQMLNYLDSSHYSLSSALATITGSTLPPHALEKYMTATKDKQHLRQMILRVPHDTSPKGFDITAFEAREHRDDPGASLDCGTTLIGSPAGSLVGSVKDSVRYMGGPSIMGSTAGSVRRIGAWDREEEEDNEYEDTVFSDEEFEDGAPAEVNGARGTPVEKEDEYGPMEVIGYCRVLYEFKRRDGEELDIDPGDILFIYEKEDDGWWRGELRGKAGIFPEAYVEEISESEAKKPTDENDAESKPVRMSARVKHANAKMTGDTADDDDYEETGYCSTARSLNNHNSKAAAPAVPPTKPALPIHYGSSRIRGGRGSGGGSGQGSGGSTESSKPVGPSRPLRKTGGTRAFL